MIYTSIEAKEIQPQSLHYLFIMILQNINLTQLRHNRFKVGAFMFLPPLFLSKEGFKKWLIVLLCFADYLASPYELLIQAEKCWWIYDYMHIIYLKCWCNEKNRCNTVHLIHASNWKLHNKPNSSGGLHVFMAFYDIFLFVCLWHFLHSFLY